MSTRAAIGRLTSKPGKKIKFAEAVYHHWDGHPYFLGKTLFNLRNNHFKGDTKAMLDVLLKHIWSTINNVDFNLPIGWTETTANETANNKAPCCYCHGGRSDKFWKMNEKTASESGVEYVYAFTKDGNTMVVLSSYCEDGSKMIGMFGQGDPKATWKVIGEVDLNGSEPDWEVIENA